MPAALRLPAYRVIAQYTQRRISLRQPPASTFRPCQPPHRRGGPVQDRRTRWQRRPARLQDRRRHPWRQLARLPRTRYRTRAAGRPGTKQPLHKCQLTPPCVKNSNTPCACGGAKTFHETASLAAPSMDWTGHIVMTPSNRGSSKHLEQCRFSYVEPLGPAVSVRQRMRGPHFLGRQACKKGCA